MTLDAISRRHLDELVAAHANVNRMLGNSDLTVLHRRINDFTPGVKAAAYDPDRTSAPNRVEKIKGEHNDETVVIPNISDPTGEAALRPTIAAVDITDLLRRALQIELELEKVLPGYTRPTSPTSIDLRASDTADKIRPGAGECAACAHECTGLRIHGKEDRLKRDVCPNCYKRVLAGEHNGRSAAATIASIRSERLDMSKVLVAELDGDAA